MENEEIKYNLLSKLLEPPFDIEKYFELNAIDDKKIDLIDVGKLKLKTGSIVVCDPFVYYDSAPPFLRKFDKGDYDVKVAVWVNSSYGDRYLAAKVCFSDSRPSRYELALTGDEDLSVLKDDIFYGFNVDAGMSMIVDMKTLEEFNEYVRMKQKENDGFDPYNGLFEDLLEENAKKNPKYQREFGDWLNYNFNDKNMILISAGFGDGVYPCYIGFDENDNLTSLYILFIDIYNMDNK